MQTTRPSSPMKTSSLSTSKSTATLWTARLVATLWKLAVNRARQLRRKSQRVDITISPKSNQEAFELNEALIMQEAALSVVASGVVSLADLEAVTGFRLSKTRDKDDDASSEAATDTSDSCSIADSEVFESLLDEEIASPTSTKPFNELRSTKSFTQSTPRVQVSSTSTKSAKWICVGYGRYVKKQK